MLQEILEGIYSNHTTKEFVAYKIIWQGYY